MGYCPAGLPSKHLWRAPESLVGKIQGAVAHPPGKETQETVRECSKGLQYACSDVVRLLPYVRR
eukprot:4599024-Alexandrium_andersonii.AAC.1